MELYLSSRATGINHGWNQSRADITAALGGKQESSHSNQRLGAGKCNRNGFFRCRPNNKEKVISHSHVLQTLTASRNFRARAANEQHYEEQNQRQADQPEPNLLPHTHAPSKTESISGGTRSTPPLNSLKSTGEVALQREISAIKQNQLAQNIQKSTAPPTIDGGTSSEQTLLNRKGEMPRSSTSEKGEKRAAQIRNK
jgi:hypothetical protein